MEFSEIDNQFAKTKQHLQNSNSFGTEVESYLTNALLIIIYATYEVKLKNIINEYLKNKFSGNYINSFFTPYIENLVKRLKTSEIINNILGKLGPGFVERFKQKISGIDQNVTAYNNIIINRHKIAHGEGSNITFFELEDSYPKSLKIIEAIDETIV